MSAIISNASHHQLLDQVERTLSAEWTVTASHTNSVTQDSAQTLEWDFSFLTSFQKKMEKSVPIILSAHLEFVMQVPASNQISLGLPNLDSELSNLSALMTLNVPIQVSAMLTLSASHTLLLDQVEKTLSAARTVNASHTNTVMLDFA